MQKQSLKIFVTYLLSLIGLFFLSVPKTFAYNPDVTILARQYVTNTVHISGRHLTGAYGLGTPNTEYILDGDITADGTAFTIWTSYIVLNLNGHTITYNMLTPGSGVISADWNKSNVAIINGTIIQGAAKSEGDVYGDGNNPIKTSGYLVANLQVANMNIQYSARDMNGIVLGGDNALIEENTIEDIYPFGTLKSRHSGNKAISAYGSGGSIIRNNTIINARNRGIEPSGGSQVYGNIIGVRSICTNSAGIFVYGTPGVRVHDNVINVIGEHPIGIIAHGYATYPAQSYDYDIYNNTITVQVTKLGAEYGTDSLTCNTNSNTTLTNVSNVSNIAIGDRVTGNGIPENTVVTNINGLTVIINNGAIGTASNVSIFVYPPVFDSNIYYSTDFGVGIRSTNGVTDLNVYNNEITVYTDAHYDEGTFSITGEAVKLNTKGRGIMVGMRAEGQTALFEHNTINMLDADGGGTAFGIACDANDVTDAGSELVFKENIVTSDLANVALGDEYGWCNGHPLFIQNTFIKSAGAWPAYHTIVSGLSGYWAGTGRFISNVYQGGAAENNLDMNFDNLTNVSSNKNKSIIFGRLMSGAVKDASNSPLSNVRLRTYDKNSVLQNEVSTDNGGIAQFMVYDYELNNGNGTTGSITPIRLDFRPHTIDLYNLTSSQSLFTTIGDSGVEAWDALNSTGIHTLNNSNGSVDINTDLSQIVTDSVAPSAPSGLSAI